MVGGDAVGQQGQHLHTVQVLHPGRSVGFHAIEVRAPAHVGAVRLPLVAFAGRHGQVLPSIVAIKHVGVALAVHFAGDVGFHRLRDLLLRRPDIPEEHRLLVGIQANRILGQVDVNRAGEGVGHHQRRRHQVVRLHVLVHAAFKVAVAAQHAHHGQVALLHLGANGFRQRTAIADTGRTTVAHHVEADGLQVREQAGVRQVFGDHTATRGKARLHPRLGLQALGHRLARHDACRHHHARVTSIGAAGNGRDDHVAIVQHGRGLLTVREDVAEAALRLAEQAAVLRSLRTRHARLHVTEI